ncbi:hypothetical protein V3C99_003727 [Haemonchus contortus]
MLSDSDHPTHREDEALTVRNEQLSLNFARWEDGYPKGRRYHSATKWEKKAVLVGGCSADKDDGDVRHVDMYSDEWSFDLETYQWKKMPFDFALPVFFHDAAITKVPCQIPCTTFHDAAITKKDVCWFAAECVTSTALIAQISASIAT